MAAVVVAMSDPLTFDDEVAGCGPWEVAGTRYDQNPRTLFGEDEADVVAVWRATARWHYPTMGGAPQIIGHDALEDGGHYQQPAIMVDAFAVMDAVANRIVRAEAQRQ